MPKLYFYDVGLASFLLGIESLSHVTVHPLRGNLFENMVVMELLKYRYNQGKRNNLNFYRDSQGNEIDVIYNIAHNVLPIEIKAVEIITPEFFVVYIYRKILSTTDRNDPIDTIQHKNELN